MTKDQDPAQRGQTPDPPTPDPPTPDPPTPDPPTPDPPTPDGGEPEERDPGLARERTTLAWTRTAISFAALGGAMLKVNVVTGLLILAIAPFIWQLGRLSRGRSPDASLPAVGTTRIRLITLSIVMVSLLSLMIALLGRNTPGALR